MIILGTNSIKATGYDVANSVRFNDGDSPRMHKTPSGAGNRRKFTISAWVKRGSNLGANSYIFDARVDGSDNAPFQFNTSDQIFFRTKVGGSSYYIQTNRVFRDVSAFYHLAIVYDNTLGTAGDRIQLWVNGVRETSFADSTMPDQDTDTTVNNASVVQTVGSEGGGASFFDGYISEFVLLDGTADSPVDTLGSFDEDSGIWKPIDVSGLTFGTNGFYLDFEDSANLGNDANGGTDLTEVNLAATDQSTDTCTNNFATWNSLQPTNATMTEGNLVGASSASSGHYSGLSTIGVTSGKWYFECKQIQESTTGEGIIGAVIFYNTVTALLNPEGRGGAWGIKAQGRGFQTDSGGSGSTTNSFTAGWSNNDTIGIALDIDNSRIYFSKGGQWNNSGSWNAANPTTSQTLQNALGDGTYFFFAGDASGSNNNTWSANFGSPAHAISSGNTDGNGYGNFEYAVPSGYFSLNTKNLAEYG